MNAIFKITYKLSDFLSNLAVAAFAIALFQDRLSLIFPGIASLGMACGLILMKEIGND